MKTLGLITARGGSKGLPGKNIRKVNDGKPLIAWTIKAGLAAQGIDRLILSSDDPAICEVACSLGCDVPFQRPAELASDTADSLSVLRHALAAVPGYDRVVLLQPTCPARTAADIDGALALMEHHAAPACVSVTKMNKSPYWMFSRDTNDCLHPLMKDPVGATRRQDLPQFYLLNGAVYCAKTDWIMSAESFVTPQTVAYIMPEERSIDIDTLEDFRAFEQMLLARE